MKLNTMATQGWANTLIRFPWPVVCTIVFWLIALNSSQLANFSFDRGWLPILLPAFLASGAAHLWSEGVGLKRANNVMLSAVAGLAAAALGYFDSWFQTNHLLLSGGLLLLLLAAPTLRRRATEPQQWNFAAQMAGALGLSILVGLVFGLGVSAIFASFDFLFGARLMRTFDDEILVTSIYLVGPVFGLGMTPIISRASEAGPEHSATLVARGMRVIASFVLVPLALIYAGVLYAYATKTVVAGELPKNQIGWMVSLFVTCGTVVWLIAWPWRDRGHILVRWFNRYWFLLLFVPGVMLAIAMSQRLSGNGWTVPRYVLAIVIAWLAVLAMFVALKRNRVDIRIPIVTAAALLLAGSFGPWGSHGVVAASQIAWLQQLLTEKAVFANGLITGKLPASEGEARAEAVSRLRVLQSVDALHKIKPWMQTPIAAKSIDIDDVSKAVGIENTYAPRSEPSNQVRFATQQPGYLRLEQPGLVYGPVRFYNDNNKFVMLNNPFNSVSMNVVGADLVIRLGPAEARLPIRKLLTDAKSRTSEMGVLDYKVSDRIRITVWNIEGELGSKTELKSGEFFAVVLNEAQAP
jgi:hypothetical protein